METIFRYTVYLTLGAIIGILLGTSGIDLGPFFYVHLLLFFLFLYVNIYIHEAGHVLMARLTGIGVRKVRIGTGRELFTIRIFGAPFVVTSNTRGGSTIPDGYATEFSKLRFFIFSLGGILAQATVAVACVLLSKANPVQFFTARALSVSSVFLVSNAVGILLSLLPMRVGVQGFSIPNDGMRLLKTPFMGERDLRELQAASISNDGVGYLESRDYERAEKLFREVFETYPEHPIGHINLAVVLLKLLRLDEAIAILESVRKNPFDKQYEALICNNLAWAYLLKNDIVSLEAAEELSEAALSRSPNQPYFRGTRGCVLIARNQSDEGIRILSVQSKLSKRIDEKVNPPTGYLFIAYGYYQQRDYPKMERYLKHLDNYGGNWDPDYLYLFDLVKSKTENFRGRYGPLTGGTDSL